MSGAPGGGAGRRGAGAGAGSLAGRLAALQSAPLAGRLPCLPSGWPDIVPRHVSAGLASRLATCPLTTTPHPTPTPPNRKCYYPGALALYAELDAAFARRTQGTLARLRASQHPHPAVLEGSSPEGGSPRALPLAPAAAAAAAAAAEGAEASAGQTPRPEPHAEPTFSWPVLPQDGSNGDLQRAQAVQQAAAAAPEAAAAEAEAAAAVAPGAAAAAAPQMRHALSGSGSFGRPPRSPRPGARPRPPAPSPQSLRQLPAGEPPLSPSGASPRSSSGPGADGSLAGSTWGASSLQTARGSGSAELADTLTSRLRPLVTNGGAGAGMVRLPPQPARREGCGCAPLPHQEGSNLVFLSARPESYKVGACGWVALGGAGRALGACRGRGLAGTRARARGPSRLRPGAHPPPPAPRPPRGAAALPQGMTESEAYRKYFQPFVQRGDLATSPTMLLGAMASGGWALAARAAADLAPRSGLGCQLGLRRCGTCGMRTRPAAPTPPSLPCPPSPPPRPLPPPPPPQAPRRCCSGWAW